MTIKTFPSNSLALLPCLLQLFISCNAPVLANSISQTIPNNVKVKSNEVLLLSAKGKGVQIYQCQPKTDDPRRFEWTFKAPEADLFNNQGKNIGRHYKGPTWQAKSSKVVGQVQASANSPDSTAIPWLLLTAKSSEGKGVFANVTKIQRIATVGGKAPATGCDSSHQNALVRIHYQAIYNFYGAAQVK
ncbi:MAG: DUF3455 domain-containing protein [Rhizonema sp. NSF051]|nr:DUF3455 domain-containing protein [Rhizonema sp. NSF051]